MRLDYSFRYGKPEAAALKLTSQCRLLLVEFLKEMLHKAGAHADARVDDVHAHELALMLLVVVDHIARAHGDGAAVFEHLANVGIIAVEFARDLVKGIENRRRTSVIETNASDAVLWLIAVPAPA